NDDIESAEPPTDSQAPSAYDLALEAARSGDFEEAMHMLTQEVARERSGRGRFLRRMQLAQICFLANRSEIALPILQDIAQEIQQRRLENWEQPETLAQAFTLLFQTMQKLGVAGDERRKIYAQICCLDPVQAARLAD